MLSVHQVSKSFDLQQVLQDVTFNLNPGERLGLVAPNGGGKTTLLRIITGLEKPDSGKVVFTPAGLTPGFLPQGFPPSTSLSVGEFLAETAAVMDAPLAEVEKLASELASTPENPALQAAYAAALERLTSSSQSAGEAARVLEAFGLAAVPEETPLSKLSGGQKTRLALARLLLTAPPLLLLDEPTNHLDEEMLEWLEAWLSHFSGAALTASHDRTFLDRTSTGILEIDSKTHKLRRYAGGYSDYLEQKLAEGQRLAQEYADQNEEIARLRGTAAHLRGLARFKKGGKADTGDKFARGFFADRGLGTMGRAKHIEQRLERLLTTERIAKPRPDWQMKMDFGDTAETGRDVLRLENLSVGYDSIALLSGLNLTLRYGDRTVLAGPNGSGKTTLLRTITGAIPPLTGTIHVGSRVKPGYMTQEQEHLDPAHNPLSALQAVVPQGETEARAFLSYYLFTGDEVFTSVGALSYGERARLSLALLVASGCNLLLLDEPINHLDIPSRTRFEQALAGFEGTVLAVVHDRYFISGFARMLWQVKEGTIQELHLRSI
jgi:ATP-binding cassette subfamily F protein 3